MKFALVKGERREAQPDLSGKCPGCESPVVAKCGVVRVWHWSHKGQQPCDPWKEGETEWHRSWKDQFPADWQEVVQSAEDGERHIADVKTNGGWVIEFQHSYIKPEEHRSREAFYAKLIWIVDGAGKRRKGQLIEAWEEGVPIGKGPLVIKASSDECELLRKWAGSKALILLDLGEVQPLWWLFPNGTNGSAYLSPIPRAAFIDCHRSTEPEIARQFDSFVKHIRKLIADYESRRPAVPSPSNLFSWDPLRLPRPRRHFRF
jgi:competence protein CoiA